MSQLDFRSELTRTLLNYEIRELNDIQVNDSQTDRLPGLPRLDIKEHVITKHAEGKPRRCKQCHTHTPFMCKKCNVHLHTKCFEKFHS